MTSLTGVWSSEHTGLYYSSFEDVTLTLAADGTGSVAFTRPGYRESASLTWRAAGGGRLEPAYGEGREVSDGRTAVSDFSREPASVSYRIAVEDTPFLGRVPVLRIDPPIMLHNEFGPA